MINYGKRIKELRESFGLSQDELASRIGTSQRQISFYENGKNEPTAHVLDALANALNTTSDYLLGRSDNVSRPINDESDLSTEEIKMIEMIRTVNPERRRQMLKVVEVLSEA